MVGGGHRCRSGPGLGVYNYILISGGVTVQLAPQMCGINLASFMIAQYSLIYFLNLVYGDLDRCAASAAMPHCCCGPSCGVRWRDVGVGAAARVVPPQQEVWHSNQVRSDLNNQSRVDMSPSPGT